MPTHVGISFRVLPYLHVILVIVKGESYFIYFHIYPWKVGRYFYL